MRRTPGRRGLAFSSLMPGTMSSDADFRHLMCGLDQVWDLCRSSGDVAVRAEIEVVLPPDIPGLYQFGPKCYQAGGVVASY